MRKLLIVAGCASALASGATSSANALIPGQAGISETAAALNDIVQVKRHKNARPRGWSRGRKVGWHGGSRPPGQRR